MLPRSVRGTDTNRMARQHADGMFTTQQLAVHEQDDVPAYRPVVEVATGTSRPVEGEPTTPARRLRNSHLLAFVAEPLEAVCHSDYPAFTPQMPFVWPNGAVTWTPYAIDNRLCTGRRNTGA